MFRLRFVNHFLVLSVPRGRVVHVSRFSVRGVTGYKPGKPLPKILKIQFLSDSSSAREINSLYQLDKTVLYEMTSKTVSLAVTLQRAFQRSTRDRGGRFLMTEITL